MTDHLFMFRKDIGWSPSSETYLYSTDCKDTVLLVMNQEEKHLYAGLALMYGKSPELLIFSEDYDPYGDAAFGRQVFCTFKPSNS